jgi:hypothetical protein
MKGRRNAKEAITFSSRAGPEGARYAPILISSSGNERELKFEKRHLQPLAHHPSNQFSPLLHSHSLSTGTFGFLHLRLARTAISAESRLRMGFWGVLMMEIRMSTMLVAVEVCCSRLWRMKTRSFFDDGRS